MTGQEVALQVSGRQVPATGLLSCPKPVGRLAKDLPVNGRPLPGIDLDNGHPERAHRDIVHPVRGHRGTALLVTVRRDPSTCHITVADIGQRIPIGVGDGTPTGATGGRGHRPVR